jgi:hypothetical protein
LSTKQVTIYIQLHNEGVPVWRPTKGEDLGNGFYRVLPTSDYDKDNEEWEFPPNTIVKCIKEKKEGKEILVAKTKQFNQTSFP